MTKTSIGKIKLSDIGTKEDIEKLKYILNLFDGVIVKVYDKKTKKTWKIGQDETKR